MEQGGGDGPRLARGAHRPATARKSPLRVAIDRVPDKFQRDAQAWLDRLAGKAGLEEGPLRPVRGATLAKWRFAIRQMASALVQAGRDPASITGLADLVSLEAAETILSFFHERANGIPTAQTGSIAANLKAIARHHVGAPEAVLAKLRRMAGKVTPKPQGMTAKNRAMLRQFLSETQQRQLLTLPGRLFAKLLAREPLKVRDALRLQTAMAVALLLAVPMRLGNLCRLEPGRHLQVLGRGRNERWFVIIPGEEVKNGEPIELPLPERTLALLRLYRERVLPVLAPVGSTYLFPGKSGPKAEVSLGGQIPRFLQRELGYRLSAHQFRHLVGFVYLQQRPDGHEVVRRMLGHRDIRTTIAFYAGMETIAAAGHYEAVVAELLAQPAVTRRAGASLRRLWARWRTGGPAVTSPDCRDPQRRCLGLNRWPAADRQGWVDAVRPGTLLLDDGPGAALRPVTLKRHAASYGRWLGFLESRSWLDPSAAPGDRASPERVRAYVAELQASTLPAPCWSGCKALRLCSAGWRRIRTGPGCDPCSLGSAPGSVPSVTRTPACAAATSSSLSASR